MARKNRISKNSRTGKKVKVDHRTHVKVMVPYTKPSGSIGYRSRFIHKDELPAFKESLGV